MILSPSLILSLFLHSRAATANTRWTPTGRRPIPLSTTTSVTLPTTTPGAGSRRGSPERRPTTTPSLSPESPNTAPLRHLCLLFPRSPHSSVPLRPKASPRLAAFLDRREAGLPLHPSRAPTHPVSTAHFTGPQAVWPQAPGPPSPASPPLFDRIKISVQETQNEGRGDLLFSQTPGQTHVYRRTTTNISPGSVVLYLSLQADFIFVFFLWSQFVCFFRLGFCFVYLLGCVQCFTCNERQSLGKTCKRIGELYLFCFGLFCAALKNCMTFLFKQFFSFAFSFCCYWFFCCIEFHKRVQHQH